MTTTVAKPNVQEEERLAGELKYDHHPPAVPEQEACQVCLQDNPDAPTILPFLSCGHSCCMPCLRDHVLHSLKQCPQQPVPCPVVGEGCQVSVPTDSLQLLCCDADAVRRAQGYAPCPSCGCWTDPTSSAHSSDADDPNGASANSQPDDPDRFVCQPCGGLSFCRWHGINAHVGVPCHVYVAMMDSRPRLFKWRQSNPCRPCPRCGIVLSKASGCDHVVCTVCGTDQCWRCGTGVHLTRKGQVVTCRNCSQSYLVHNSNFRRRPDDDLHENEEEYPVPIQHRLYQAFVVMGLAVVPPGGLLVLTMDCVRFSETGALVAFLSWLCWIPCFVNCCMRRSFTYRRHMNVYNENGVSSPNTNCSENRKIEADATMSIESSSV